jgi:hypothetical protein
MMSLGADQFQDHNLFWKGFRFREFLASMHVMNGASFSSTLADVVLISLKAYESFRLDQSIRTLCICRFVRNERLTPNPTLVPIPVEAFAAAPMGFTFSKNYWYLVFSSLEAGMHVLAFVDETMTKTGHGKKGSGWKAKQEFGSSEMQGRLERGSQG